MTLEEAKKISNHVTDIFARKPRNCYLCESQLCGYSPFDIHHAYALTIALRRQLAAYDPSVESEAQKYADLAAALVVSIPAMVLPDQEADRLAQAANESDEYNKIKMGIIVKQINRWNSDSVWRKQEALDSFNKFCWLLDPEDALYWQKVYSHLGMPYDSDSPKGMPDLTFDDTTPARNRGGHSRREASWSAPVLWRFLFAHQSAAGSNLSAAAIRSVLNR